MSHTSISPLPSRPLPEVTLCSPSISLVQVVLVGSGADTNLIDMCLAKKFGLGVIPFDKPLKATFLDGRLLWYIAHSTIPVKMTFSDRHWCLSLFEFVLISDSAFSPDSLWDRC